MDKNCKFQEPLLNSIYSLKIYVSMFTKFNFSTRRCSISYSICNNSITASNISWYSLVSVIRIFPLNHVIKHHWTPFCGVIWRKRSVLTSTHPPVHWGKRFNVASTKFSHIYATPHLCNPVLKIFDKRVGMCQQSRGGHLSFHLLYVCDFKKYNWKEPVFSI